MTNHDHAQKRGGSMLGLAIAGAIGAALGLLFAPKKGEDMRKEVSERAREIASQFNKNRAEIQETVQEIFGEVNEDLERAYVQIHSNILAMVDEAKKAGDVTRENYQKIVKDVVKEFSRGKQWSQKVIERLTKTMEEEWADV